MAGGAEGVREPATGAGEEGRADRIVRTVGHSTRSAEAFVALLVAHGVDRIVDVRRYPGSRRHPWFGSAALARTLEAAGIGYRHEVVLGGRRSGAPDSPNGAWRSASFRAYADHLLTDPARDALDRLEEDAAEGAPTVLCAEAVPWRCHRQLIADHLVARGLEVRHILGENRAEGHVLHEAARILPDARVVYPAGPPEAPEQGVLF